MRKQIRLFTAAIFSTAAGLLALPATGVAAPQALALVATSGSTELICKGAECSAEFSSFCLQPNRASPNGGTAYRLEGDGAIRVTGTTAGGRITPLDPATVLRFESLRTHVAVRVAIPQSVMQEYGLTSVSIDVDENVALAPTAVAGDANPQDDASLAAAAGPLRELGNQIVDRNDTRMAAARLTSRMINDLEARPIRRGDVTLDVLSRAVTKMPDASPAAQKMAQGALNMCNFVVERRNYSDVQNCLQHHHDRFMVFLNGRYWDASGAGM